MWKILFEEVILMALGKILEGATRGEEWHVDIFPPKNPGIKGAVVDWFALPTGQAGDHLTIDAARARTKDLRNQGVNALVGHDSFHYEL